MAWGTAIGYNGILSMDHLGSFQMQMMGPHVPDGLHFSCPKLWDAFEHNVHNIADEELILDVDYEDRSMHSSFSYQLLFVQKGESVKEEDTPLARGTFSRKITFALRVVTGHKADLEVEGPEHNLGDIVMVLVGPDIQGASKSAESTKKEHGGAGGLFMNSVGRSRRSPYQPLSRLSGAAGY
jgi:hypothetical protein